MTKEEALRLQRGDQIRFGETQWKSRNHFEYIGTVRRVTCNGGILVTQNCKPLDIEGRWVAYHHVSAWCTKAHFDRVRQARAYAARQARRKLDMAEVI